MPTVLITGANRGIGFEFTRQYAADGYDVIACCRQPAKADDLQKLAQANPKIRIEQLEVTDQQNIDALAKKLDGVSIDILINNAGVPSSGKSSLPGGRNYATPEVEFAGLNAEAWINTLKINTIAPIMVTRALTPHILRSREKKIIMISSRFASIGMDLADLPIYSSSKAGLNIVMRKLALLLKPQNVAVISFHPGWVQTNMGGPQAALTPQASVDGMRTFIANLTLEQTGQFFTHSGERIPW